MKLLMSLITCLLILDNTLMNKDLTLKNLTLLLIRKRIKTLINLKNIIGKISDIYVYIKGIKSKIMLKKYYLYLNYKNLRENH